MGRWCRVRADSYCYRFVGPAVLLLYFVMSIAAFVFKYYMCLLISRWENCAKISRVDSRKTGQGKFAHPMTVCPCFLIFVELYMSMHKILYTRVFCHDTVCS